ncbi:MAG: hypothetical protein HKN39_03400 [Flavobacteriales bacterium]|nr:hypothetical protein [Flavobacteriales bacterium]
MLYRIAYALVKEYTTLCIGLFFRKVEVKGKHHIPKGPVIFTPNHQNAFLDGILTSCLGRKNVSFLARADVFNIKILKPILLFFKIVPVYRMRDGASNMENNYGSFKAVKERLDKGKSILIFPEGNQKFIRHLRPLKKGVFRILDLCKDNKEIPQVVPVGINFESHTRSGFNLVLEYGEPVPFQFPLSNGYLQEKNLLTERMLPLFQNIQNYDLQMLSESSWLNEHPYTLKGIQEEREMLIHRYPEQFLANVSEWRHLSFTNGLLPWHDKLSIADWLKVMIVGIIYLPIMPFRTLVRWLSKRINRQKEFKFSMTFGFSLVLLPFYVFLLFYIFVQFLPAYYFLIVILLLYVYAKNKEVLERFAFHFKKWRRRSSKRSEVERMEELAAKIRKYLSDSGLASI